MAFWNSVRVLVTGADGFIGGNLSRELVRRGAHVVSIARDFRPYGSLRMLGLLDKVAVVHGDVADLALVQRVLNEYSITHCFHLAAQALVGVAATNPLGTFESNIRGTYVVLEACRTARSIQSVVVASSDKAYGIHERLPYEEDAPLLGLFPYDASKACADILARSYCTTFSLPCAVTRSANVYGPGDMNFSRLVPDAVRCALRGVALDIRSDGRTERDYLFVEDAVAAYLTLGEALSCGSKAAGEAFNFGTEVSTSALHVATRVADLCGSAPAPRVLGTARHEIGRQYLDASKARRMLQWKPTQDLDGGLRKTIEWYRDALSRHPVLFS